MVARGSWLYRDVQIGQAAAFIMVKYPNKNSPDLYMAIDGAPIHCCNCLDGYVNLVGVPALLEHIDYHDSRKRRHKDVIAHWGRMTMMEQV